MFVKVKLYMFRSWPRFSTITIAFLCVVLFGTVLRWKLWTVNFEKFVFALSKNQRLLAPAYKNSENTEEKNKKNGEFQSLYFIHGLASEAVAWQPVAFDIRPRATGGVLLAGRTTFWAKARNKLEVLVLDITRAAGDVYRASFVPSFGGEYNITVLLTYVNGEQFNYGSHVASKLIHIHGSPRILTVESRSAPEGITRYCSQAESGIARGRWVRCGSLGAVDKCGPWQLNMAYDFDKLHGFFWLPYACQMHQYTNHQMKTCLAKNAWEKIVFTGDSHSRYRTYHWITRLYGRCANCHKTNIATRFELVPKVEWVFDARGTRWPASFPSITRPTEIYINSRTRRSMFSNPLPKSTDNGDLYLLNFGHWLIREVTFKRFMAEKLRAFVEAVRMRNVSITGAGGKPRFLWVNTMSLRWRETEAVRNWTMTPAPSVIAYMNSFMDRAMRDGGIQVVDAFQVSNVRLNAVHDATHYAKVFPNSMCAGAVENAVTNVILNALCNG